MNDEQDSGWFADVFHGVIITIILVAFINSAIGKFAPGHTAHPYVVDLD